MTITHDLKICQHFLVQKYKFKQIVIRSQYIWVELRNKQNIKNVLKIIHTFKIQPDFLITHCEQQKEHHYKILTIPMSDVFYK